MVTTAVVFSWSASGALQARPGGDAQIAPALVTASAQQRLINAQRAVLHLPPLTWNECLARVAAENARRLANQGYLSHADGVRRDLTCELHSRQTGENVGYWSTGINDARLDWLFARSPHHLANILGPYTYVGTAWVVAPSGAGYIAVEFG